MLNIHNASYFVPQTRLQIESAFNRYALTKSQAKVFSTFYGLEQVPCAQGMSVTDLVCMPIAALLKKTQVEKDEIKVLIHAHTAKVITCFGQSVVRQIKQRLALDHALAFGTSLNNCASTLNAFEMAAALLANYDQEAKALIVTGERAFTPTVQVIPNTSITGDAAAAALVSHQGKQNAMLSLEINIAGQFNRGIWLNQQERQMFEQCYVPLLSDTIQRVVKQAGLSLNDIKCILPHNVNLISWKHVAKAMQYPLNKIYLKNVRKYAHCFGADILINFVDAQSEGVLQPGDFYVMATVGLGATFAAAVFQY